MYIFIILIPMLALLIVFLLSRFHLKALVRQFRKVNVIVFGKKGTGKDLLFQGVISARRKEKYYANISYGYNLDKLISPKDISIMPNDYTRFINDKLVKVQLPLAQKEDVYLSDVGVYLPSTYDSTLNKTFPSFPPYYALNRHLTLSNVHCNCQNLERVWKQLREQADFYVRCRGVIKLPFFVLVRYTTYDRYKSAVDEVRPLCRRLMNNLSKVEVDKWKAQNGEVKNSWFLIRKKSIKYNTRAFYDKLVLEETKDEEVKPPVKENTPPAPASQGEE